MKPISNCIHNAALEKLDAEDDGHGTKTSLSGHLTSGGTGPKLRVVGFSHYGTSNMSTKSKENLGRA